MRFAEISEISGIVRVLANMQSRNGGLVGFGMADLVRVKPDLG